jgi:hypothetical protein
VPPSARVSSRAILVHPQRARSGRLPEAVVLQHARAAVAHQLRRDPAGALAQHLGRDQVVGAPAVADLPGQVLTVAPGLPVDLVGLDAGGVLAGEEAVEAVAQDPDGRVGDEALLEDQEAVAVEGLDGVAGEGIGRSRQHPPSSTIAA